MKLILTNRIFWKLLRVAAALAWAFLAATVLGAAPQSAPTKATAPTVPGAKLFNTPEQAADALVDAAAKFDVDTLYEIFGPSGDDIYLTGEYPQDRQRALEFAAEAHEKKKCFRGSKNGEPGIPHPSCPLTKPIARTSAIGQADRGFEVPRSAT